jgi:ribA/ribD-fused uncharacterized protein
VEFRGRYFFLSNFFPHRMMVNLECGTVVAPTLEHAYQASKTTDIPSQRLICICSRPSEAKRLGRKAPISADWELRKLRVMEELLRIKFSDETMRYLLQDTGDEELVEGNNWGDTFWGVCNGVGENHLGKLLMKIRQEHVEARD